MSDNNVTKLADREQIETSKEIAAALNRKCADRDVRHGATVLLQAIASGIHGWEQVPITPPELIEIIRDELSHFPFPMRKQQADRFSKLLWDASVPDNMIATLYDRLNTGCVTKVDQLYATTQG